MGYLLRKLTDKDEVCDAIKHFATDKTVIQELGEPLIYDRAQVWWVCYEKNIIAGFICYKDDKILYAYTVSKFRRKGIFNLLYLQLPHLAWKTVASNASKDIFLKKGFTIIKSYNVCHKMKLCKN